MPMIRKRKLHSLQRVYSGNRRRTTPVSEVRQTYEECQETLESEVDLVAVVPDQSIPVESPSDDAPPVVVDSRYDMEKKKRVEEWRSLRDRFKSAYISLQSPDPESCVVCRTCDSDLLYRCLDCCMWETLCLSCIQSRHNFPHLHIFEVWKNEAFLCYSPETIPWILPGHNCNSAYLKEMVIVDDKGRQHLRSLQFCRCESEAVRLIRFRLWPASPKFPKVAFHFDLMYWLCGLLVESAVSVRSFCSALEARCSKHLKTYINHPIRDIYKLLIAETADEFRHFLYNTENLNVMCDDKSKCPACYQSSLKVYSCDADFQLVRKDSSGKQWQDPKHDKLLFLDQDEVDSFIEDYSADKRSQEMICSDFQAGSNLRSKYKNKKLSETAVFGSACRHEIPKMFFSLKHGERLGYSVFLLKKLLEEHGENVKIHLMYDIACSLYQHLKKNGQDALLERTSLSIPVFHAYGHKVDCQVLFSARRTEGIGLTDGEGMERIWSYLGKFAKITKEMTSENRVDLLTDALLHYGQKMKDKLGSSLPEKIERAIDIEKKSQEALQEILQPFSGASVDSVKNWLQEERLSCERGKSNDRVSLTPKEQYSLAVEELTMLSNRVVSPVDQSKEKKRLEAQVKKYGKSAGVTWVSTDPVNLQSLKTAKEKCRCKVLEKLQQSTAERLFLLDLMKKYARGQSVAVRLGKQLKKANKKIREQLLLYNAVGGEPVDLPVKLNFDDIRSCEGVLWNALKPREGSATAVCVPVSVKQQAVRLYCMTQRAAEEQQLVVSEMQSTLEWYMHQHTFLLSTIPEFVFGEKAAMIKEGLYIEMMFNSLLQAFQQYLPASSLSAQNSFATMVDLVHIEETRFCDWNSEIAPVNKLDTICESDCISSEAESEDSDSDDDYDDDDAVLQALYSLSSE